MASIYKKAITKTDPATGEKLRRKSVKWWIKYRDGLGRIRRRPGFTDKAATLQLAAKWEKDAALVRAGVVDEFEEYRTVSLRSKLKSTATT